MVIRNQRGVVLLELLVALVLLSTAGLATVLLLAEGARGIVRAARAEAASRRAERLLQAYALMTRRELEQRIGEQDFGPASVQVQRPSRTLFRIAVRETGSRHRPLLVTVLFRPESP